MAMFKDSSGYYCIYCGSELTWDEFDKSVTRPCCDSCARLASGLED